MRHEERQLQAADGTDLRVTLWHPEGEPRFALIISHGQSDHVGRHAWLAEPITSAGGLVFGPDHRGEGCSGGPRGHVDGFESYAADLAKVTEEVCGELPEDCPRLLFCHSMGGLIGLHYLLDHGERLKIRGAVVSAPLIELVMEVPFFKRMAARVANLLVPTLGIPSEIPPEQVLNDPVLLEEYVNDPDRNHCVTPRWVASMERGQARIADEARKLKLPMLWYGGTKDLICSTPATRRVFDTLEDPEGNDQTFRLLEGASHEPHNEPPGVREEIRDMVTGWVIEHAG